MKSLLRDLFWILPVSLGVGLTLSLLDGGTWWIGLLAYGLLLALGLLALTALWRAAGASRTLLVLLLLALFLRLGFGLFFSYVLPIYGNDSDVHNAGFIYRDASTYDRQAWELAASGDPLWKAFDRSSGIEEQYGGLTLALSLTYRLLSPDLHRPWLTILLVAVVSALGVGFAWRGIRDAYGEKTAWAAAWILALYPESILTGCSQIREPFLLLFSAMFFWALTRLQGGHRAAGWAWLAGGLLGMFLFSPPAAGSVILVGGIWVLLFGSRRRVHWGWVVGVLAAAGLAFLIFGYIAGSALQVSGGPFANVVNWLRESAKWSLYGTQHTSDGLEPYFAIIPNFLHLPMVTAYGVFQPLLPAAIADLTVWPVSFISIFRSLGWYLLLPLLAFAPFIGKKLPQETRLAWWWLGLAVWTWILVASFRAGGDQWDNPRYRLILVFFQALLGGQVWVYWRESRDAWFGRLLSFEGIFLVVFLYWYEERYAKNWAIWRGLRLPAMFLIILASAFLIFVGGWIWDRCVKRSGAK